MQRALPGHPLCRARSRLIDHPERHRDRQPKESARSSPRQVYRQLMALTDGKYVRFTTFRRDGTPVSTPVWIVPIDERTFGFWTSSGSGKAKRLAHTDRVTVQSCNARGVPTPGSHAIEATARLVTGPEFEAIRRKVIAKYGAMTKVTKMLGTISGVVKNRRIPYGDRGVVVTVAAEPFNDNSGQQRPATQ